MEAIRVETLYAGHSAGHKGHGAASGMIFWFRKFSERESMTSQTAANVGSLTECEVASCAQGAAEMAALTKETEAAAAAMSVAVGLEKNAALLQYKQAMRRLVRYLSANNAIEHRARF